MHLYKLIPLQFMSVMIALIALPMPHAFADSLQTHSSPLLHQIQFLEERRGNRLSRNPEKSGRDQNRKRTDRKRHRRNNDYTRNDLKRDRENAARPNRPTRNADRRRRNRANRNNARNDVNRDRRNRARPNRPNRNANRSRRWNEWNRPRRRPHRRRHIRSARDLRPILRSRGFNRIEFSKRGSSRYSAIVCKHNRKIRLRLNRYGEIIGRKRIGRCDNGRRHARAGLSLREIKGLLRDRGYREISFRDRRLPRYSAKACRRGARFDLILNRWGDIVRRERSGWCRAVNRPASFRTPIISFDERELSASTRLDADSCQNQLDYLIDRQKIYFDIDSVDIDRESYSLVRRLSHVMKRCPTLKIEVAGHTDSVGSDEYNYDLSQRRAYSVARELSDLGVSRRRLKPKGYGEDHPVVSNETDEGKAQNRRIDFIVAWQEQDYAGQ